MLCQMAGVMPYRVLIGHKAVADDSRRQAVPGRTVLCASDQQTTPLAGKLAFCNVSNPLPVLKPLKHLPLHLLSTVSV